MAWTNARARSVPWTRVGSSGCSHIPPGPLGPFITDPTTHSHTTSQLELCPLLYMEYTSSFVNMCVLVSCAVSGIPILDCRGRP